MPKAKSKFLTFKKSHFYVIAIVFLIFLASLLLWIGEANSSQATGALMAKVRFQGQYQVAGGSWQEIRQDGHIPATAGDVILRGNFHILTPDGEYIGLYSDDMPIAFYTDHISLTFYEEGCEPFVIDSENPIFGDSACGVSWTAHSFTAGNRLPIEIHIHNPHSYGNETAIDALLAGTAFWANIDFEKGVLDQGEIQRNLGIAFMIAAMMLLGIALFSSLIHIKNSKVLWLMGLVVLFAGVYFAFHAEGVSFWQESVVANTVILGSAMMFYMLFLTVVISGFLKVAWKVAHITVICLGAVDALVFVLPMVTDLRFYDTWLYWAIAQMAASGILMGCIITDCLKAKGKGKWSLLGAMLPLLAFGLDVVMTGLGTWKGGTASQAVFLVLFVTAMLAALRIIPRGINAAAKAKELETEKTALRAQLTESRISTMMSQIRPHFIYNTLGSIEQLCNIDPPKAGELVHNFAKYLRGNFGELDNPAPIPMTREMEHVHHYIRIENVRFPDMTFSCEMNSCDFRIPALTIQPIVEKAIKHGLMKLPRGGTIRVVSYETDTHYCVEVEDDGAGFEVAQLSRERKHVGIRNIRERLKTMVSGSLEIRSTVGVGTKVLITIPKEVQK